MQQHAVASSYLRISTASSLDAESRRDAVGSRLLLKPKNASGFESVKHASLKILFDPEIFLLFLFWFQCCTKNVCICYAAVSLP